MSEVLGAGLRGCPPPEHYRVFSEWSKVAVSGRPFFSQLGGFIFNCRSQVFAAWGRFS